MKHVLFLIVMILSSWNWGPCQVSDATKYEVRLVSFAYTNFSGDSIRRADQAALVTEFFKHDQDRFKKLFNFAHSASYSDFSWSNVKMKIVLGRQIIYVDRYGYYTLEGKVYSLRRARFLQWVTLLSQRIPAPPDQSEVDTTLAQLKM